MKSHRSHRGNAYKRFLAAIALIAILLPGLAAAQNEKFDALSLQSGARARIQGPDATTYSIIGVKASSRDSLSYTRAGNPAATSLAWPQIKRMDVSAGQHRHFGRGLGFGFLIGGIGGALFGAATAPGGTETGSVGFNAGAAGVTFAFFGAIVGGIAGYLWQSENWIPVAVPRS